ncbi:MAG: ribonuclease domain-containing protein [Planctomycetota bacterium]
MTTYGPVNIDFDHKHEAAADRSRPCGSGKNGSTIFAYPFSSLPFQGRMVINMIVRGDKKGGFWFDKRDGVTIFQNRDGDLPDGGEYREYTVLENGAAFSPGAKNAPGAQRIVHEVKSDTFYYTPTHYQRVKGGVAPVKNMINPDFHNPFYQVVDTPYKRGDAIPHGPGF